MMLRGRHMDNKVVELQKILYPENYVTSFIFTYPTFNDELKELISKSGYVKEFKIKYYKSLRFLEQLRRNCIMQSKLFEKLLDADGIYSIMQKKLCWQRKEDVKLLVHRNRRNQNGKNDVS